MTTPRRYVRIEVRPDYIRVVCDACLFGRASLNHAEAVGVADDHARTCPTIRAAMERDQLRAELDRMRTDRDRLRDRLHTATYNLKHQRNDNS